MTRDIPEYSLRKGSDVIRLGDGENRGHVIQFIQDGRSREGWIASWEFRERSG